MSKRRLDPTLLVGLAMLLLLCLFVGLGQVWTPHDPFFVDYAAAESDALDGAAPWDSMTSPVTVATLTPRRGGTGPTR